MSREAKSGSQVWGWVLIGLGIAFLLDRFDVIDFGDLIAALWPLVLVGLGIKMILNRERGDDGLADAGAKEMSPASGESHVNRTCFFGDNAVKLTSKHFTGGNLSTIFGSVKIDLTEADFVEGESVMTVNGVFGDIHVTLPARTKCAVRSHVIVGQVEVVDAQDSGFFLNKSFQSDGYDSAKKKLHVSASQVFGNIVIEQPAKVSSKKTGVSS